MSMSVPVSWNAGFTDCKILHLFRASKAT